MENTRERLSIKEATGIAIGWTRRQTGLPSDSFITPRKYSLDRRGRRLYVMSGTFLVVEIIIHDDKSVEVIRDRRNHPRVLASI